MIAAEEYPDIAYSIPDLTGLVDKAFGSLSYEQSLSEYKDDYRVCDLQSSIEETEK